MGLLGIERTLDDNGTPIPSSRYDPRRVDEEAADERRKGFGRAPTLVATGQPSRKCSCMRPTLVPPPRCGNR